MRNMLCTSKWHSWQHRLVPPSPLEVILSIADNRRIPSQGRWTGIVNVAGTEALQSFEIFDSKGAFQAILGKPWLCYVKVVPKYATDQIVIQTPGRTRTISNDDIV